MELIYLGVGVVLGIVVGYLVAMLKSKNDSTSDDNRYILKEVHQASLAQITKMESSLEFKEIECIDLNKALSAQEQIVSNQKEKLDNQEKNLLQTQEQLLQQLNQVDAGSAPTNP